MQAVNGTSLGAFQNNQASINIKISAQSLRVPESAEKPEKIEKAGHEERENHKVRSDHGEERATQIFRQEISQTLKIAFRSTFSLSTNASNPYRSSESPEDLATDVMTAAKAIVEDSPAEPAKTLVRVRQSVEQAITSSKQVVNTEEGASALKNADDLISRGLRVLENDTQLTSASALSVQSKSTQRSTIQIRTQEGDTIKFDLRRVDKLSATDISLQSDTGNAEFTEISLSSRSRLVLQVKGDLNSAELDAIKNVFTQAEQLAEEFFAGDLNAALEVVAGLEFDSSQLAKVSMKFRSSERISAQQTILQSTPATPVGAIDTATVAAATPLIPTAVPVTPQPAPAATPLTSTAVPVTPQPAPAVNDTASTTTVPAAITATPETETISTPVENASGADGLLSGFSALADFLGQIADFLDQNMDQFSGGLTQGSGEAKLRFEFTESVRLDILKAVMIEIAPEHDEHDDSDSAPREVSSDR